MNNKPVGPHPSAPSRPAIHRATRCLLLCAAALAAAGLGHAQQPPPALGTWSHIGMLPGYSEMFVADIDNRGNIVGGVWGAGGVSTSVLYSNGRLSEIANLGLPGGAASDISNAGHIVGGTLDRRDPPHTIAYIRQPDGTAYTLPGPPGAAYSTASHVNDFGEAVGTAYLQDPASPGAVQSAFFYDRNGQRHALGWGAYTVATGLNNAGQVVGQGRMPGSDAVRAFTYRNGSTIDLGTLGGAIATTAGINEAGQIAGTSSLAGPLGEAPRHAYLWDDGSMTDLGTLGGSNSEARDLNNTGDVVGSAATSGTGAHHAFLWRDGAMHDLGTFGGPGSVALHVNERGDVAGVADLAELDYKGNPVQHAFLWRDGRLIDLSASLAASFNDISQIDPYSVHMNDVGHITLYGITASGLRGIFLLTPVPEPATWALLLAGALALRLALRRRTTGMASLLALCFAFAAGAARAQAPSAPAPAWSVVNIGALDGSTETVGLDFNDRGEVVGYARFAPEPTNDFNRPFLYSNGRLTDITAAGTRGGFAVAINNSGQIAATLQGLPGSSIGFTWRAYVYNGGRATLLATPAGTESSAEGLNERGDVLVSSGPEPFNLHVRSGHVFRADGTRVDLPGLGGVLTRPHDINEAGQVVGEASLADARMGIWQPFLYDQGRMTNLAPAGSHGNASVINEHGVAAGVLYPSDHAAVFANGTATDLGTFGGRFSSASDINDANQVVGSAQAADGSFHAFLYEEGEMRDLNSFFAGSTSTFALDVNNLGQIGIEAAFLSGDGSTFRRAYLFDHGTVTDLSALIGSGRSFVEGTLQLNEAGQVLLAVRDDLTRAITPYLLTPVPEPAVTALMLAGLVVLGAQAARRRRQASCRPALQRR